MRSTLQRTIIALVIVSAVAAGMPRAAHAEEGRWGGRSFALGVSLLKELGFGALVRGRFGHLALEGAFGYSPYFVMITGDCEEFVVGAAPHATGSAIVFFSSEESRFQSALRVAGIWDRAFGAGAMLGYVGEINFSSLLALEFGAGFQYYWNGEEEIVDELPQGCAREAQLSFTQSNLQFYLGASLLFYLF